MDKDQLIKLIEKNEKIQKFVLGKTIKKQFMFKIN